MDHATNTSATISNVPFLESVDAYIDHAMQHLDLSEGLAERIKACNSTYTVRFGVRLRGRTYILSAGVRFTVSMSSQPRAAFDILLIPIRKRSKRLPPS